MPDTHWLRCGSLITGVDEEVLHDVAVGIQGELITDVRPWAELASAEQRSSRDLTDTLVTPGFIDAHVHLLFTCDIDHDVTRSRFETADIYRSMTLVSVSRKVVTISAIHSR